LNKSKKLKSEKYLPYKTICLISVPVLSFKR